MALLKFKHFLRESELPSLGEILSGNASQLDVFGIMTAWNPGGKIATSDYNQKANERLIHRLVKMGMNPIEIRGAYQGVPEKSFLIPGISREELIDLGREFDQAAVVFGSRQGSQFQREMINLSSH